MALRLTRSLSSVTDTVLFSARHANSFNKRINIRGHSALTSQHFTIDYSLEAVSTEEIVSELQSSTTDSKKNELDSESNLRSMESILALLNRSPNGVYACPPTVVSKLAERAFCLSFTSILRLIVEHTISGFEVERRPLPSTTDFDSHTKLAQDLLKTCAHDCSQYGDLIIPLIMRYLSTEEGHVRPDFPQALGQLSSVSLTGVLRVLIDREDISHYMPLVDALVDELGKARPILPSRQGHSIGNWNMYRLVMKLLEIGQREDALRIFQGLVDRGQFPPAATIGARLPTDSERTMVPDAFDITILMSIARACQINGWILRTASVLRQLVGRCDETASQAETDMLSRIVHEIIVDLIAEKRSECVSEIIKLVDLCLSNEFIKPPPPRIIESIYKDLAQFNRYPEMLNLVRMVQGYAQTRWKRQATEESNPEQYEADGGARRSAPSTPPYLWPRYDLPRGTVGLGLLQYMITSEPDMSLFGAYANNLSSSAFQPESPTLIADYVAIFSKAGYVDEASRIWHAYRGVAGSEVLRGNAATAISLVRGLLAKGRQLENRKLQKRPEPAGDPDVPPSEQPISKVYATYQNRAKEVVADYVKLKKPLKDAAHATLTSIASLGFMVGDLECSFAAMKAMLDRRTMPDGRDITVAVAGVAKYDSMRAARLLDKALRGNVPVSKHVWTTVIKEAYASNDYQLAEIVLHGALTAEVELDSSLIDVLIRNGLRANAKREDAEVFLARTYTILRQVTSERRAIWPSLARDCVNMAIKWKFPKLAFDFWDLLLRKRRAHGNPDPPQKRETGEGVFLEKKIALAIRGDFFRRISPSHVPAADPADAVEPTYTYANAKQMCAALGMESVLPNAIYSKRSRHSGRDKGLVPIHAHITK